LWRRERLRVSEPFNHSHLKTVIGARDGGAGACQTNMTGRTSESIREKIRKISISFDLARDRLELLKAHR
jgi:hypothetical protein